MKAFWDIKYYEDNSFLGYRSQKSGILILTAMRTWYFEKNVIFVPSLREVTEMNAGWADRFGLSVRIIKTENCWINLHEIRCEHYAQNRTFQFTKIANTNMADQQNCEMWSILAPLNSRVTQWSMVIDFRKVQNILTVIIFMT